jgi:hypothetical protein
MRARRRRKVQKHDLLQMLGDRLRDTARWAAFLGSFAGVFVAFDEGIAHVFGKARCNCNLTCKTCFWTSVQKTNCHDRQLSFRRTAKWRAAAAGAAAGPTLLLTG